MLGGGGGGSLQLWPKKVLKVSQEERDRTHQCQAEPKQGSHVGILKEMGQHPKQQWESQ